MDRVQEAKKSYQRTWLKYAIFVFATGLAALVFDQFIMKDFWYCWWYGFAMTITTIYVIGFPIIFFLLKKDPKEEPAKNKQSFGWLVSAFMITMFAVTVGTILEIPFTIGQEGMNASTDLVVNGNPVMSLVLGSVLAPIFEELIFRKLLIDHVYKYGEVIAIISSGIAFGLFHKDLTMIIYTAFMGCVFAYVYVRSGNILYTIGLHVANNLFNQVIVVGALRGADLQTFTAAAATGDAAAQTAALAGIAPILMVKLLQGILAVIGLILFVRGIKKKKIFINATSSQLAKKESVTSFANIGFVAYVAAVIFCMVFPNLF